MGFWERLFGGGGEREAEHAPAPRSRREALARERALARGEDDEPPARPRRVRRIEREVLELIFETSRASHPHEFGAALRAEGDTITEIILVPGTLQGDRHAILPLGYLPTDRSIVGTVHSHPGPSAEPSDADLQLFRNFGHTHIILHEPYSWRTWIAYDTNGEEIELEVV